MNEFQAPERSLAGLDAETTASLIAAAADVALIVDDKGVIRDVSVGSEDLVLEGYRKWVGRSWAETVTVESRPKVVELLRDAGSKRARRWRHLNHPSPKGGDDVPVLYSAIRLGKEGSVVAFGRDMRSLASLQQRLVDAQHSMERDYLQLRHMETRYRLLFQLGSEPVLIVDATTQRVVEANPAAARLLGDSGKRLVGRLFTECFEARSRRAVTAVLGRVPPGGRTEELDVRPAGSSQNLAMSASIFKQEDSTLFLVRLAAPNAAGGSANADKSMLLRALETVPDGFVVTDPEGRILSANAAFVEMTQLTSQDQLRGESLDRWLGRSGVDLGVLIANLRQQGSVRLFATTMRGLYGATAQVEISATSVPHDEHPCLGFTVRDVGRRLTGSAGSEDSQKIPRSVGQLTKLVGRVPLKDIVGETTDMIEKLCIEAALELTRDNRASAAEMLGLSRQSLYVKLRRYGLGDLGGDAES